MIKIVLSESDPAVKEVFRREGVLKCISDFQLLTDNRRHPVQVRRVGALPALSNDHIRNKLHELFSPRKSGVFKSSTEQWDSQHIQDKENCPFSRIESCGMLRRREKSISSASIISPESL